MDGQAHWAFIGGFKSGSGTQPPPCAPVRRARRPASGGRGTPSHGTAKACQFLMAMCVRCGLILLLPPRSHEDQKA